MANPSFKEELNKRLVNLWKSRLFQIWMDIVRIAIVILLIYIIYTLVSEIEIVKQLGQDVCALCMNKTGCTCYCPII